jgi:uncharacterized membrane protein YedE/YeeE
MNISSQAKPYVLGALAGVLLIVSVVITGEFFGTSTTFPRVATLLVDLTGIDLSQTAFYQASGGNLTSQAFPDWQLLFVIGIALGALISAAVSKTFKNEAMPSMWVEHMGSSKPKRIMYSLVGGAIGMIGARIAGGCPSGHGISGMSQLGVSSLLAMIMFFASGIAVSRIIYRGRKG